MTTPHHTLPPTVPPENRFTVLVIDDMAPNRMVIGKFLGAAGYAVVEATNGAEALELLRDGQFVPDLVVTDVEMPVMDGISLVEQIRYLDSAVSEVPVITASGNADDDMRREALAAGSDVFLAKPFDFRQLAKEMSNLLRTKRRVIRPAVSNSLGQRFPGGVELNS